jgi:hypothetical protein
MVIASQSTKFAQYDHDTSSTFSRSSQRTALLGHPSAYHALPFKKDHRLNPIPISKAGLANRQHDAIVATRTFLLRNRVHLVTAVDWTVQQVSKSTVSCSLQTLIQQLSGYTLIDINAGGLYPLEMAMLTHLCKYDSDRHDIDKLPVSPAEREKKSEELDMRVAGYGSHTFPDHIDDSHSSQAKFYCP